jgi:hypothetical protein
MSRPGYGPTWRRAPRSSSTRPRGSRCAGSRRLTLMMRSGVSAAAHEEPMSSRVRCRYDDTEPVALRIALHSASRAWSVRTDRRQSRYGAACSSAELTEERNRRDRENGITTRQNGDGTDCGGSTASRDVARSIDRETTPHHPRVFVFHDRSGRAGRCDARRTVALRNLRDSVSLWLTFLRLSVLLMIETTSNGDTAAPSPRCPSPA